MTSGFSCNEAETFSTWLRNYNSCEPNSKWNSGQNELSSYVQKSISYCGGKCSFFREFFKAVIKFTIKATRGSSSDAKKCGFNFLQFFFLGNCKGIGREKAALSLQSIWVIPILTFCSFLLLLLAPSSMAVRGFFNSIRLLSFDPDVWTPWSQFLWRRG